jgi:hypothetical protein
MLMMDRTSKFNHLLFNGSTTAIKFQINEPPSIDGGLGLVAIENIAAAEDVFSMKQMLVVADDNHSKTTCDNCFLWIGSEIGANGRFRAAGDADVFMRKCNGCKVVRYCSKVTYIHGQSLKSHLAIPALTIYVAVLSTEGLEIPSQSRMQDICSAKNMRRSRPGHSPLAPKSKGWGYRRQRMVYFHGLTIPHETLR